MAFAAEPVEGAAHIELLLGVHIEEGQVDRRAARVAALLHNVLKLKQSALVDIGVEIAAHCGVAKVGSPADEVVYSHLRAVGIVDFQAVALGLDVVADGTEAVGGAARKQRRGLQVAVDAGADEIVGAVVADFEDGVGHHIGDGDEVRCQLFGRDYRFFLAGRKRKHRYASKR